LTPKRKSRIGVLGPGQGAPETLALATEVGAQIARAGAVLICGGLGGVMEAAARGARQAGGLTVGIIPGSDPGEANDFIDVPIATGMGEARNGMVVRSSNAVIAIAGSYGTLSEIALALKTGVPVVGLGTWNLRHPDGSQPPILTAHNPSEAVAKAVEAAGA